MKLSSIAFLGLLTIVTSIHAPGYCSMYDNCGKKSIFGSQLPCPSNIEAVVPDSKSIELLKSICGEDFPMDKVCCSQSQLINLQSNLKKVDPLISSCPACRKNFYDFFCEFTCSSNQSMFINITETSIASDTKKDIVSELTQYVDAKAASKFYDSCKGVKFSATNGYAMDLIGGGAKNYSQFLKFLGDEKPLLGGSPFQINYKYDLNKKEKNSGLILRDPSMKNCNDKTYKCACSDCDLSCPALPYFTGLDDVCVVGSLRCFSFATIIVLVTFILAGGLFHVYLARFKTSSEQTLLDNDLEVTISPSNFLIPIEIRKKTLSHLSRLGTNLSNDIEQLFANVGYFCAKFPGFTIGCSVFFCLLLTSGVYWLNFETNPVNLWVSPNEPHLQNYQYFEDNFGEWYRIEQIIISKKNGSEILDWDTVKWWFEKELELQTFESDNSSLSLDEFCFKPLGDSCLIESFTQYFGGDINYLSPSTFGNKIANCADSPVNCLPSFQQPLKPNLLFDTNDVINSKAFVVTLLLNRNSTNQEYTDRVIEYETNLKNWLLDLQDSNPDLSIAFSTENSLTEELNKSTNTDIGIVVISYLLMFFYASLSLGGKIPIKATLHSFVHTRFQLGLGGIIIILLSVVSSLGLFSLIGLKSTLIIAEVIPFLVLAIGIDNIFLIVHELNIINDTEEFQSLDIETRISKSLQNIGPSCLISAILQISMFLLATNVDMPAVKNFAYYSAGAILINFLLQMTAFIGLLSLDQQRLEDGRSDIFPWIRPSIALDPSEGSTPGETTPDDPTPEHINHSSLHIDYDFTNFISKTYAPKILRQTTKPKILTFFVLWLGASLSLLPYIELGLDQKLALPKESYLLDYFDSVYEYLNVGPPIFFVIKDLDLTQRPNQQKLCGKFSTCEEFSLSNILEQEYKRVSKSTIAEPVSNWLDDYLTWLNPNLDQCCRVQKKDPSQFCSPNAPERSCQVCYEDHDPPYDISMNGLPEGKEFMFYFNDWIQEPSDPCPLGGKAPYGNAIAYNNETITSSYFRTYHSPLRSQKDFIVAFKNSLRIVDDINKYQKDEKLDIFAFSPFYIFFVQYDSIISLTFKLLGSAMIIIWFISFVLLQSFRCSTILTVTIISILVNIGGFLALWGVSLNAVSLVNLIICVGLAVEFCIHVTRGYLKASSSVPKGNEMHYKSMMNRKHIHHPQTIKAYNSLITVGSSVLSGITITKFIGILVLAFTRSKIFEVYYFRMWFSLIVIAGVHSLCILPILLSYFGDSPEDET